VEDEAKSEERKPLTKKRDVTHGKPPKNPHSSPASPGADVDVPKNVPAVSTPERVEVKLPMENGASLAEASAATKTPRSKVVAEGVELYRKKYGIDREEEGDEEDEDDVDFEKSLDQQAKGELRRLRYDYERERFKTEIARLKQEREQGFKASNPSPSNNSTDTKQYVDMRIELQAKDWETKRQQELIDSLRHENMELRNRLTQQPQQPSNPIEALKSQFVALRETLEFLQQPQQQTTIETLMSEESKKILAEAFKKAFQQVLTPSRAKTGGFDLGSALNRFFDTIAKVAEKIQLSTPPERKIQFMTVPEANPTAEPAAGSIAFKHEANKTETSSEEAKKVKTKKPEMKRSRCARRKPPLKEEVKS